MKLKLHIFLLVITAVTFLNNTQAFAQTTFQKTFGGGIDDHAYSVEQTGDGGYIIAGVTNSFGAGYSDIYLIKTFDNGDIQWTKTFGGLSGEIGYSVQQTMDGGYVVAGLTNSFGAGYADVCMIKTDVNGDTLWTKTFGGSDDDAAGSIQQTYDGGYIIAGNSWSYGAGYSDVYLVKTDSVGDTLWTKTFGGSGDDGATSVIQTSDSGFVIAGYTNFIGSLFYKDYIIRTNSAGDTLWAKTYGGGADYAYSVQQASDGGFIIAGTTASYGAGSWDACLFKIDSAGDMQWTKTYGDSSDEKAYSVRQTSDGGYIIAGTTNSFDTSGTYDVYLIRTDSSGDTLWTKTFGGIGDDVGYSVRQTNDGGYVIAGYTNSSGEGGYDMLLIRTDSNGNSNCNQGTPATIMNSPVTAEAAIITQVSSGGFPGNAPIQEGGGGAVTTICFSAVVRDILHKDLISIYPNPAAGKFIIKNDSFSGDAKLKICNIMGGVIFTGVIRNGKIEMDLSDQPKGICLIQIISEKGIINKKLILE